MGESFDHRPPGRIRQSRKGCTQSIHNHMVVDLRLMSSANFAVRDCGHLERPSQPLEHTFPLISRLENCRPRCRVLPA